ncbi:MAG TPA: lamin tail domain-containing protein [Candidatus Saccharimonadales bacterium]|nr:lamin tail domain-containing protein [Candidatus Saccharimonadales bacterium]
MGIRKIMRVGLAFVCASVLVATVGVPATAEGTSPPKLVISQFKVTTGDGQFFSLYNPSATTAVDLSVYQLDYFNNIDMTKATSSKLLPLSGSLAPHSYYMMSDGAATICYEMTVNTASLGFSTTSGFVELVQLSSQAAAGTPAVSSVTDYVGWSKSTSKGNDILSVGNPSLPLTVTSGTNITWLRQLPVGTAGLGAWQPVRPDPADACSLQLIAQSGTPTTQTIVNPGNQLGIGQQPPATIVSLAASDADTAHSLPALDIGLTAPQITELMPNPDGAGTDGTDEFIELYNPNVTPFDLTGFTLETGMATKHKYIFPDGSLLQPKGFTAFYSVDTGLTLSNTSGLSDLLDPFGNTLSQTEAYGSAKDGQAWALANGKWYWTSQATPNAANVIKQVAAAGKTSKSSKKSGGAVKGASTTTGGSSYSSSEPATQTAPVHPGVLAAVGVIAVGYGIYEYRQDIADRIYEFRRNRRLSREARA